MASSPVPVCAVATFNVHKKYSSMLMVPLPSRSADSKISCTSASLKLCFIVAGTSCWNSSQLSWWLPLTSASMKAMAASRERTTERSEVSLLFFGDMLHFALHSTVLNLPRTNSASAGDRESSERAPGRYPSTLEL